MTWNYRVLKQTYPDGDGDIYGMHEVYYDEQGKPHMFTENEVALHGESQSDILLNLAQQQKAYQCPILISDGKKIIGQEEWDA